MTLNILLIVSISFDFCSIFQEISMTFSCGLFSHLKKCSYLFFVVSFLLKSALGFLGFVVLNLSRYTVDYN